MQLLVPACQKQVPPYGNAPIPSHQACVYLTVSIQILCREVASHVLLSFASNRISSFCSFAIKNWTTVTQWYAIRCMCLLHSIYFLSMTAFDWEAADVFCSLMSKLGTCRTGLFCQFVSGLIYTTTATCRSCRFVCPFHFDLFNSRKFPGKSQRNGRSWVVTFQICQIFEGRMSRAVAPGTGTSPHCSMLGPFGQSPGNETTKRRNDWGTGKDSEGLRLFNFFQLTQLFFVPELSKTMMCWSQNERYIGNRGYKWSIDFPYQILELYHLY